MEDYFNLRTDVVPQEPLARVVRGTKSPTFNRIDMKRTPENGTAGHIAIYGFMITARHLKISLLDGKEVEYRMRLSGPRLPGLGPVWDVVDVRLKETAELIAVNFVRRFSTTGQGLPHVHNISLANHNGYREYVLSNVEKQHAAEIYETEFTAFEKSNLPGMVEYLLKEKEAVKRKIHGRRISTRLDLIIERKLETIRRMTRDPAVSPVDKGVRVRTAAFPMKAEALRPSQTLPEV